MIACKVSLLSHKRKNDYFLQSDGCSLTGILLLRRGCKVQCSSKEQSSTLPVYSTICVNIIHHHMVQSYFQILNATCCVQTVTFSFNPKTSSVGCHRVMVLKKANIATLSTCPLCKDAGNADRVKEVFFRDFCLLHTIRNYMCTLCV